MSDPRFYPHPVAAALPVRRPSVLPASLTMGAAGLIVGAACASAENLRRMNNGEIDAGQMVKNVVYDAAGTAVASAVGTAAVKLIGVSGVVAVASMFAAATATRYLYDEAFQTAVAPAAAPETAPDPAPPKTAPPKRSAVKSRKQPPGSGKEE